MPPAIIGMREGSWITVDASIFAPLAVASGSPAVRNAAGGTVPIAAAVSAAASAPSFKPPGGIEIVASSSGSLSASRVILTVASASGSLIASRFIITVASSSGLPASGPRMPVTVASGSGSAGLSRFSLMIFYYSGRRGIESFIPPNRARAIRPAPPVPSAATRRFRPARPCPPPARPAGWCSQNSAPHQRARRAKSGLRIPLPGRTNTRAGGWDSGSCMCRPKPRN